VGSTPVGRWLGHFGSVTGPLEKSKDGVLGSRGICGGVMGPLSSRNRSSKRGRSSLSLNGGDSGMS